MKKKSIFIFGSLCFVAMTTVVGATIGSSVENSFADAATQNSSYKIIMNKNNAPKELLETPSSLKFTHQTAELNNDLTFEYSHGVKLNNGFITLNADGFLRNPYNYGVNVIDEVDYHNRIAGITSIEVVSDNNANISVAFGWDYNVSYDDYSRYDIALPANGIYDFEKGCPSYFKLYNKTTTSINITSIELTYSCIAKEDPYPYTHGLLYEERPTYCNVIGYEGTNNNVIIPAYHNGKEVMKIESFGGNHAANAQIVTIADGITSLDGMTNCKNLVAVVIPVSCRYIGRYVGNFCNSLKEFFYKGEQWQWERITTFPEFTSDNYKVNMNQSDIGTFTKVVRNGIGAIVSENNLAYITGSRNKGLIDITSAYKGYKVLGILSGAFSFNMGDTYAITIPEGVWFIDYGICKYLNSLLYVSLPSTLQEIGNDAFYQTDNIIAVDYAGTEEQFKKIKIGQSNSPLTESSIAYNCTPNKTGKFINNDKYEYVTIDDEFVIVGKYKGTEVDADINFATDFPNMKPIAIGFRCFAESKIASLYMTNTMRGMAGRAFEKCQNIFTLYVPISVYVIKNYCFDQTTTMHTGLTVNFEAKSAQAGWESYAVGGCLTENYGVPYPTN